MHYLYLVSAVFLAPCMGVSGSLFGRKTAGRRDATTLYQLIFCVSAALGWVALFFTSPSFDARVIPYSLIFGLCYAVATFGYISALRTGPVALTSFIVNLSMIATVIWGFFFWDTRFTWLIALGLALVAISLWLCLYTGREKSGSKISLKWLLYTLTAFAANSGCCITQKTQQLNFDGQHGSLMMLFAIFSASLFSLFVYLRSDKSDTKSIVRSSAVIFPIFAGCMNVLQNLMVILLATAPISPGMVYPVIAVGDLSLTSILSIFLLKERLRIWQWCGIAIGAAAVVILSI